MKKFFIFFTIGFTISIAIYRKLNHYQAIIKQQMDVTKVGESAEFNLNLKKSGCYEVGFGNYECDLTPTERENMKMTDSLRFSI
ncbi:MAG: hypothetical protein LBE89_08685 [Helicobacteraceae bacterium]|jgi:hypothetical protein|nr:hypothetical protein [Helicobacteraceae bacterium]